jgi:alpha-methylacyl-CoA racemase
MTASGPLKGIRVLEFAGIGPAPFCAMLLSDMGAEVLRLDRKGASSLPTDVPARGRRSFAVDLKNPTDIETCLQAVGKADILIEGFRPGVMERLGLGPDQALARNPRLIYGRMTGWGQDGPLAQTAGHDINYIAITGALEAIGPAGGVPVPPLNLVGDYGGGSLYLAFGIAAALFEREASGKGQVIDAAIVDGTASLMAMASGVLARGLGTMTKGKSLLGGSAPFYRCYECADGRHIAVGPIEPQFFAILLDKLGIPRETMGDQNDRGQWHEDSTRLAAVIRTRARAEWCELLEGTDACCAPVLSLQEATDHPHIRARGVLQEHFGLVQPAPAPRFSRTPGSIQGPPATVDDGGEELLRTWGITHI